MTRFAAALLLIMMTAAAAGAPSRIVSINLCTDQLLADVADPGQIAALSPYAADPSISYAFDRVKGLNRISASAEEVLVLKPDLVLAGRFSKAATKDLLRGQGLRVEDFDLANDLDGVKAQWRRIGALTGHSDRAEALVAKLDAEIERTRTTSVSAPPRVLPLQRRGWVSGSETLIAALLRAAGVANAADALRMSYGGFVDLETLVTLRPDLILLSRDEVSAQDQGSALLLHPALERAVPHARWLFLPGRLTVCGGSGVIEALERLRQMLAPR